MRFLSILLLCLLALTLPTHASEPVPGDSCAGYPTGSIMRSGGPELGGAFYTMKCTGGAWVSIGSGGGSSDTEPDAFSFTDVTDAALDDQVSSGTITISGIDAPASVSVSGDGAPEIRINGGSWVTSGTIEDGQTLEVRLFAAGSFAAVHTATISVGGITNDWNVTTLGADTTPNAFDFTPNVTNANPGTVTTSNSVTISGINTSTPVSATGGAQFRINGGSWGTSGNITNGQTLEVRLTASASFSAAVSTTVTVGSVTDSWSVTTRAANSCSAASRTWLTNCTATVTAAAHGANGTATIADPGGCGTTYYGSGTFACADGAFTYSTGSCTQQTACDTTPNAFIFTDVTGANTATLIASNNVTISGINTATPVSATGGAQFRINGGSWVTTGNITNGQTLEVRLTSSASFSTAVSSTVTVGTVSDSWSITTRAPNSCSAASQTWLTNCTATASAAAHGANGTATITNPGGCGTAYYGSGTFACADGAFTYSTGSCTQQTACDTTPNAFDFTPNVTDAALNAVVTASNTVTIGGINTTTPVSVSGTGAQISIAGGAWVTNGNISNGQTLTIRITAASTNSTVRTATVNVGGITDTWSVTTIAAGCGTSVGEVCADGSVYAGMSGSSKMFATRCDFGQTWNGTTCTGTRTSSCDYQIISQCQNLVIHGKSDWVAPTPNESVTMNKNQAAIGNFSTATYLINKNGCYDPDDMEVRSCVITFGYTYPYSTYTGNCCDGPDGCAYGYTDGYFRCVRYE